MEEGGIARVAGGGSEGGWGCVLSAVCCGFFCGGRPRPPTQHCREISNAQTLLKACGAGPPAGPFSSPGQGPGRGMLQPGAGHLLPLRPVEMVEA